MRDNIDVSIIIPTYNRLWSLPEAIDSCRSTKCNIEILVVDDGSADGTWEWLQTQGHVRSFRQFNQGKAWAVNRAVSEARGEWIRFLDSDDLLPVESNEIQLSAGRSAGADVVVAGYIEWDSDRDVRRSRPWPLCDDFISQQLGECESSHYSAFLFRRMFISQIPHRAEFGSLDDRMFIIEVALLAPRVVSTEVPCLIHRIHQADRLQRHQGLGRAASHWHYLNILRRSARRLELSGELTERRRSAIAKSAWPLAHWIGAKFPNDAKVLVSWIRALDPSFQPPEKGLLGELYRRIGFDRTQKLLAVRRAIINPLRKAEAASSVYDI